MALKTCLTCQAQFEDGGNGKYCPGECREQAKKKRAYGYHRAWVKKNKEHRNNYARKWGKKRRRLKAYGWI